MCSYFIWIGEDKEKNYARERQIAYFRRAVQPAILQDPSQSPPSMLYMNKIVEILDGVHKEDLGEKSILLGSTQPAMGKPCPGVLPAKTMTDNQLKM